MVIDYSISNFTKCKVKSYKSYEYNHKKSNGSTAQYAVTSYLVDLKTTNFEIILSYTSILISVKFSSEA